MFRIWTSTRAFSTRSVAAHRALLRGQDNRVVEYIQTKRFVDGLAKADSLDQLKAVLTGLDPTKLIPKHVSLVAYKIGELHKTESKVEDDAFKATAISLIDRHLDAFSVSSLSSLLMSLRAWRWPYPKEWPERLSRKLFSHPRLSYKPLSRAVPVLADLGVTNADIWADAINIIEKQLPFLDQLALAQCIYGVSRARQGDARFYESIVKHLEPRCLSLDPSILSKIVLSLSRSRDRAPDLTHLFDRMSEQVLRQLPIYNEEDIKKVVSAFSAVTPRNTKLFTAVADQISSNPDRYQKSINSIRQQLQQLRINHESSLGCKLDNR